MDGSKQPESSSGMPKRRKPSHTIGSLSVWRVSSHDDCMLIPIRHACGVRISVDRYAAAALCFAETVPQHRDGLHRRLVVLHLSSARRWAGRACEGGRGATDTAPASRGPPSELCSR
eukprot:356682-Chlamydomonas_euryale.AAC.3